MITKFTFFKMNLRVIFITLGALVFSLSSISAIDYTGAEIVVSGLGQYTGEGTYVYSKMLNDKPSFSYQNKVLEWKDSQWQIYSGAIIFASNISDTDSVPANGWVILNASGDTITVTGDCVEDNIASTGPSYVGATITVSDIGLYTGEGEYVYKVMLNGKPSFSFQNKMIEWNDSEWQIYSGASIYASNAADTDSVPANGWVILDGASGTDVTLIGDCVEDNEYVPVDPYENLELTISGAFNGTLAYYEMVDGVAQFGNDDLDDQDIFLYYNAGNWIIKVDGVDSLSCYSTDIPENGWKTVNSKEVSDFAISHVDDITTDLFEDYTISGEGLFALTTGTFTYAGTENGYPAYSATNGTSTLYLMCSGTSWEIRANDKNGVVYHECNVMVEDFNTPQNKWSAYEGVTPSLSGYVTLFFYDGSIITISGSESGAFDGDLLCTGKVGFGLTFEGVIDAKVVTLILDGSDYTIWLDGTIVATATVSTLRTSANALAVPQNGWYTVDGNYYDMRIDGELAVDMYASASIDINDVDLFYTQVANGRLDYASEDGSTTLTFSESNEQWEISIDGVLSYVNDKAEQLVPENSWTILNNGEELTFGYSDMTVYSYLNEVVTVSGDITGEFVFTGEFFLDRPIYSTTEATGDLVGKTAYISYNNDINDLTISYDDGDSLVIIYKNIYEETSPYLVPQNKWTTSDDSTCNVTLSGNVTYFEMVNTTITISGTGLCDTIFTYGYENFKGLKDDVDYIVKKKENALGEEYWTVYNLVDYLDIYTNFNISGDFIPQTGWMSASDSSATDVVVTGLPTFSIESSAIDETRGDALELLVYPTLANQSITVESAYIGALSIYNTSGVLVMNQVVSTGKNELVVSNLNKGIYIVVLNSNNNTFVSKIVKQ